MEEVDITTAVVTLLCIVLVLTIYVTILIRTRRTALIRTRRTINKSKKLAKLLRHNFDFAQKHMNQSGYVLCELVCKKLAISQSFLDQIVSNDKKTRFEFNHERTQIRAAQGHSKRVSGLLDPSHMYTVFTGDICKHGTEQTCVEPIMREGLSPRNRGFVHFVGGRSGPRPRATHWINVDCTNARAMGVNFWVAGNGVILGEGIIPPSCLSVVEMRS